MYCRNYRLWKSWLDHSLKSAVSEHAFTVNMGKRPKCLQNLHERVFIIFFMILRKVDLENSPLVLGEILALFLNTLTANGK